MTSFVANNFLWSCCRRHLVGKLNRPSIQFSESRKETVSMRNDLNLSIYPCQSTSCSAQTIIFRLHDDYVPYNMTTTDTTIESNLVTSLHPMYTQSKLLCDVLQTDAAVMTSSRGDVTDDAVAFCRCTLCDAVSRTDSLISSSLTQHRVQTAARAWPPASYGPRPVDQVPSSRGLSPRVVSCQASGSVFYEVVRPLDNDAALYSQSNSATHPCFSARSTAAIVQPYCHLDDNIGASDRAAGPSQQQPSLLTPTNKSCLSLPRTSMSTSNRLQYAIQTLDSHYRTGLTTKTRDVVQKSTGTKSTSRKYLSKSCPNIRLVSTVGSQPRRLAVMSTFGKSRPAVQYDCISEDCCNLEAEKIFGFENSVYFGGREVDLFNGMDAMHRVSEAAGDKTRLTSHQSCQSTYGTLDTARASGSTHRTRTFLSTDRGGKQETARLNSAVCKPIITTRHHKVSVFSCFFLFNYIITLWRGSTEWANKVSCCIAGCNFVSYGPMKRNSNVRKLTEFPESRV